MHAGMNCNGIRGSVKIILHGREFILGDDGMCDLVLGIFDDAWNKIIKCVLV